MKSEKKRGGRQDEEEKEREGLKESTLFSNWQRVAVNGACKAKTMDKTVIANKRRRD